MMMMVSKAVESRQDRGEGRRIERR